MRHTDFNRFSIAVILFVFMTGILAPGLEAQYFGRNKVQYQRFDFQIMKTRHFDIYFYLEEEDTVRMAGLMAERWYSRLSRMFNVELKGRQPLILYGAGPEFQQTTVIPGEMGEGTGGVTESFKRRIVLPYGASLSETDHVIGHELVHAFQYDIMAMGHSDGQRNSEMEMRIPLWFIEGMAEYLSIGPVDPNTAMWMRDAVLREELPQIRKLDNYYKYFPYRWGHALWSYITGRWGDEVIGKMMKSVGRTGSYEAVLEGLLGVKLKQLSSDWHKSMQDAYKPLVEKTETLEKTGRAIFQGTETALYNISPSVSPDGKEVVFLSTRDLFSVDLFLGDVEKGRVIRKIISTAVDPHFESLQFIRSAGSWDSAGEKFVFGGIIKGKPALTILDMKKNKIEREIPFPEIGEILSPAWSPDGSAIAFCGLTGGVSDIFVYSLADNVLRQLTRDVFGDLQPVFSPDGRRLAFVTERFSTNMDWLEIGNYELALLDLETGEVRKVLGFPNGKNINPQWSPDGNSLYFLSDQTGKTDMYRIDLETEKIFTITNLYTGISGITDLSPAISVSSETGKILFSGYDKSFYTIYSIESEEALVGQAFLPQFDQNLAVLPPRSQPEGALLGLLRNPLFGLPKDRDFPVSAYKPKLALDYITPPSLAIGVDRYGTYGAGGIAAYWSDMLGYHTLATSVVTYNRLMDTSGLIGYLNSKKRLNWGAVARRISYPYSYYYLSQGEFGGEPVIIETEEIYRTILYDASLIAYYPFSKVKRLEFSGGFRYYDFDWRVYNRIYSAVDGALLSYDKERIPTGPGFAYGYLSAGYVYDSGIFGATSPILGQSFFLSATPTLGSLTMVDLAADFRKYLMPIKPFTFAIRALHYGRYGKDSEDTRLYPVYIAYWDLVRGYESFTADEYNKAIEQGKDPFDTSRLVGSKMIVANVELRFPLLGVLGIGKGYFGAWPLEFYGFYDVGIAWANNFGPQYYWGGSSEEDVKPWFLNGNRKPVQSAGIGLRTNIFGYLVLGLNYVYPITRPERGWHLQLSISPGF